MHQMQLGKVLLCYTVKPQQASYPEIMQPRLSLNGNLRHLVPSPGPLCRDHSSRSIQPLTANEQQMAELDGSFYSNITRTTCLDGDTIRLNATEYDINATTNVVDTNNSYGFGGSGCGGGSGGGQIHNIGGIGRGNSGGSGGFHTTEFSITPSLTGGDDQCIDLGSVRRFSIDRHSYLDLGSKFGMSQPKFGQSVSQQGFFTSHDSLATPCASRASNPHVATVSTASDMDLLYNKQARRKSRGRLKDMTTSDAPLLGSWNRSTNRGSQDNPLMGSHNFSGNFCNGTDRGASMLLLVDGRIVGVSLQFLEINRRTIVVWFCLDYFSDFLYLIDIFFHFRTGYLEDGVLQTDAMKLRQHYMNSTTFYIDCLCLLPLDFLYLSIGFNSILRSFRLVKIYRFWAFMDRTERHTNYPNLFRSLALIHYLLVIFHWNGCLYHIIHKNNGFGSRNWVYHDSESADVVKQYLQSYYWCTLALTTIGDLPKPRSKGEYVFVILQLLFGLMLFATVLGHVANIVTSVSAARKEFQDIRITPMFERNVFNNLRLVSPGKEYNGKEILGSIKKKKKIIKRPSHNRFLVRQILLRYDMELEGLSKSYHVTLNIVLLTQG
uniref:Ion transport domain-containing protein n=1 Tax=Glossina palpalis gambiensis TaxID=67801 RepID=A0A1B0BZN5_9MUSC